MNLDDYFSFLNKEPISDKYICFTTMNKKIDKQTLWNGSNFGSDSLTLDILVPCGTKIIESNNDKDFLISNYREGYLRLIKFIKTINMDDYSKQSLIQRISRIIGDEKQKYFIIDFSKYKPSNCIIDKKSYQTRSDFKWFCQNFVKNELPRLELKLSKKPKKYFNVAWEDDHFLFFG